jgi:DNA uptake protein ComE-like DNA-binding protein
MLWHAFRPLSPRMDRTDATAAAAMSLFQHKRTGQIVELISYHDKDYAMIKNQAGSISYAALEELEEYVVGKGRTGQKAKPVLTKDEVDPEVAPIPVIPPDTRLNLNLATAEMIAQRIKGVGYSTAKKIIEIRQSLPGERFSTLEQLKAVGRVDWDQVLKDDLVFVG